MNNMKRLTALVMAGALALSVLTGCGKQADTSSSAAASSASAGDTSAVKPEIKVDISAIKDISTYLCGLPSDTVVAVADGDIEISAGELMYWMATNCDQMVETYYYYQGTQELPWTTVISGDEGEEEKTFAQYMVEDSIKYAVMQRIVEKKAKEAGVTVSKEDQETLSTSIAQLAEELKAETDKVTVEQFLWQQGLTNELLTQNYEMTYLYQGLADHLYGPGGENEPTDETLKSYLDDSGYYRVKHILLDTKEATDEEKAQKKTKMEGILAQIKAASDLEAEFDKLMNEHSEDPGLITNPEGYTFQANTTVDPAFEEATLALEPGQLSEIVEGMHGYHIMLRLPIDDPRAYLDEFISEQMSLMGTLWIETTEIDIKDAGKALDGKAIYDAMQAYRETVAALMGEE